MPSSSPEYHDGTIDFLVPSLDGIVAKTYYKVYGTLRGHPNTTPLVCLHGGPGAVHIVIEHLKDLNENWDIPIIFYDQIGNGLSTHFHEKNGDVEFWNPELFMAELDNLLRKLDIYDNYDIYGQSVRFHTLQRQYKPSHSVQLADYILVGRHARCSICNHKAKRIASPYYRRLPSRHGPLARSSKSPPKNAPARCPEYYGKM